MSHAAARLPCRALAAALAAAAAACSSGGGHEPNPPPPPPPPTTLRCDVAPAVPANVAFTVSGTATYDFVPATYNPATDSGTLSFASAAPRPIRGADVQVWQCGNANPLASTTTDETGHYTVAFTPGPQGEVGVFVLARVSPGVAGASAAIQVVDNTSAGAIWTVGAALASASATLDVHATSGWTGSSYGPGRIAGPFAILDDLYTAERRLLDLPRAVAFDSVPLTVNWSPLNVPSYCGQQSPDYTTGCIGTSFYDPSVRQIFVLGADGHDTDEYDREVIVHEWGHYFEDNFSRADSPGGSHGFGDVLDPRLAFGEGYASAFAAILLQQTIYADTGWLAPGIIGAFGWDVENVPLPTDDPYPGPFSELSVIRTMWDLYDAPTTPGSTAEAWDGIATGLGPIYDTLVGPEKNTHALTTIASFVAGLKQQPGVDGAAVDTLLAHSSIGPIADEFGAGDPDFASIYTDVAAPSMVPFPVTATLDGTSAWNQASQNHYYVFTATGTTATVSSACPYDVDLYGMHVGQIPTAVAESTSGYETIRFATTPGEIYVVIVTGWGGVSSGQSIGSYSATITFSN